MAKFKVYVFATKDEKECYVLAASEEMALLRIKQFTHLDVTFVRSRELTKLDAARAFILYNQIKPF